MKKIIFLFAIIFISQKINSQVNADCINAVSLCSNPSFQFNSIPFPNPNYGNTNELSYPSTSNPSTNPASTNAGCLQTNENNPQWLIITVGNAGSLEFVFGAATSANPQSGFYDWAMWPYSPTTCNQILNNTLPPIRCNWNGPGSGGTGIASASNIPTGGSPQNYEPPLLVNACQQFVICISNYSNINTLVSFQTLGTASLSCNPNCNPNYAICAGANATISPVNFAGLTSPTYSLNPGAVSNTTGSFVVSPTVTTTYITYITGLNGSNVVQTTTALSTVTVNPQPSASPTTTQSTCTNTNNAFNLGVTFNPATPVPNYTVNWSPMPATVSNATQTAGSGANAPGLYSATITSAGGCSVTASFSLSPVPPPVSFTILPIGSNYTITCAQPTVVLNSIPASYNYTWTNGVAAPQTGTNASFTSANMGTWTATAVNPVSGCTASQTFVVTQNVAIPTSTVTPILQNITCAAGSAGTFTGITTNTATNMTHSWYSPFSPGAATNGGTVSIFNATAPGTYTYCVTDNVNGCSTCKTVTITSSSGFPLYNISSPQQFTIGCSTTSITTISISTPTTFPSPGGPVSYTVLPPTYTLSTYGLGGSPVYTVNAPGQYTVIVHDNTNNCETKIPVSIISNTFSPQISTAADQQTLTCTVPKTLLHGTSTNTNVGFSWAFPGSPGTTPNDTLTVFSNSNTTASGTVVATYTMTITDNINKCKSTQTLTIYQNISGPTPIIVPSASVALTCSTPSISLTNSSTATTATLFPHTLIISSDWNGPSPQISYSNVTSYNAYTPGTYTMYVTDLNNGCRTFTTKTVGDNRVYPIVNIPVAPGPFILDCAAPGATIYPILGNTNTSGFTYTWQSVPTASFSTQTASVTVVNKPGVYRIYVTNSANGCVSSGNVQVINGSLNGNFNPSTTSGFAPLTVNFTNLSASSSSTTPTASISSAWSFGNGTSLITPSVSISPSTTYVNPGTYTVTLYVNKGSCVDTVVKVITVDIPSKLEVPNVFTPNGDGSNDVFFLKVQNVTDITAFIFDRWGNKVFETTSSTGNIEWDGKTQSGKEAAAGTYFYIIKGTGKDGTGYDKKGNVSIYR